MGSFQGKIEKQGPFLGVMVMATSERVDVLKALGEPYI
jgi:hypothetical protein